MQKAITAVIFFLLHIHKFIFLKAHMGSEMGDFQHGGTLVIQYVDVHITVTKDKL